MYFKIGPKGWIDSSLFVDLPFLHQMGITTLLTMAVIAIASLLQNKGADDEKGIEINSATFKTSRGFNIGGFAIILCLVALYALFWK